MIEIIESLTNYGSLGIIIACLIWFLIWKFWPYWVKVSAAKLDHKFNTEKIVQEAIIKISQDQREIVAVLDKVAKSMSNVEKMIANDAHTLWHMDGRNEKYLNRLMDSVNDIQGMLNVIREYFRNINRK